MFVLLIWLKNVSKVHFSSSLIKNVLESTLFSFLTLMTLKQCQLISFMLKLVIF